MSRTKAFLMKELRLLIAFLGIVFIITVVPDAFSFNTKSAIYTTYYEDVLPIAFSSFLFLLYLLRVIIVFTAFFIRKRFYESN